MPAATADDLRCADRILVYGVTGSGKSTAARRLGAAMQLPVHLVDEEIGWLPGWVGRPEEEQIRLARLLAAEPRWVLDSAYGAWVSVVLEADPVVVALDYPRAVSLGRLLRRTARRVLLREETCNGNRETLRTMLAPDSIVVWHFRSFRRKRERVAGWEAAPTGPRVLRLRHPRELEDVIAQVSAAAGPLR